MLNPVEMNATLIANHIALIQVVVDQNHPMRFNLQYAMSELTGAVVEAARGGITWQENTNSDLCAALHHCTLAYVVENFDHWFANR